MIFLPGIGGGGPGFGVVITGFCGIGCGPGFGPGVIWDWPPNGFVWGPGVGLLLCPGVCVPKGLGFPMGLLGFPWAGFSGCFGEMNVLSFCAGFAW